jgi:Tat protein translocase TatB subunit
MFGLGLWEIFAILLVAIVFINPKDLPKIARTLGKWYSRLRNFSKTLTANVNEIIEEEIKKPFEEMEKDISTPVQELEESVKSSQNPGIMTDFVPDLKDIIPSQDFSLDLNENPEKDRNKNTKK